MTVEAARIGAVGRGDARAEAWWAFPAVPLLAAAIAFTWTVRGELQRVYGMTGSAWDLAYDQQVIWNISQGQGFYTSFARANFLGIHFELIFAVLAAVEKFWPSPTVLLIFSSAGLAATAPAAYLFFRAILPADRTASPWLGARARRPGAAGRRCAGGAPQVKKHWRFILYGAGAWFLIGTGIVQQHFRNGGYTDFVYYRWLFGLDPNMPVTPLTIAEAALRPGAVLIVAGVIASMFALPLLAPRWLLLAIPPYLADVLSGHNPQNVLHLHYVLLLMFPLIVVGGIGARRFLEMRSIKPAVALGAMLPALILGWGTGKFPPALGADLSLYSKPNLVAQLRTATSMIPPDAPVNADDGLTVWLANRHTINDFPDRLDASCYVVIDQEAYVSGPTNPAQRLKALDTLQTSGRRLLYDDGRFQVWSPVGD